MQDIVRWAWVRHMQSTQHMILHTVSNVCMDLRLSATKQEELIGWSRHTYGVTYTYMLHTDWAHRVLRTRDTCTHGQLKALSCQQINDLSMATKYKSLLYCSHFFCCLLPVILPLAKSLGFLSLLLMCGIHSHHCRSYWWIDILHRDVTGCVMTVLQSWTSIILRFSTLISETQAPWSLRIQYINSRYEVVITQGKFKTLSPIAWERG